MSSKLILRADPTEKARTTQYRLLRGAEQYVT